MSNVLAEMSVGGDEAVTTPMVVGAVMGFVVLAWGAAAIAWLVLHKDVLRLPRPVEREPKVWPFGVLIGVAIGVYVSLSIMTVLAASLGTEMAGVPELHRDTLGVLASLVAGVVMAGVVWGVNARLAIYGRGAMDVPWSRRLTETAGGVQSWLVIHPLVMLGAVAASILLQALGVETPSSHPLLQQWGEAPDGNVFRVLAFLTATIAAPVGEETLFRGVIQPLARNVTRSRWIAIVISSLAFAAMHQPWPMMIPIFLLALGLGWTYEKSGSLTRCIVLHMMFNLVQFGIFLTMQRFGVPLT